MKETDKEKFSKSVDRYLTRERIIPELEAGLKDKRILLMAIEPVRVYIEGREQLDGISFERHSLFRRVTYDRLCILGGRIVTSLWLGKLVSDSTANESPKAEFRNLVGLNG